MGLEYKIGCSQHPDGLDKRLRSIHGFSEYDREQGLYHFRSPENQDTARMPDASAGIEPDGIYFNDHGGKTELVSVVFRRLIDAALAETDEVTIKEL